MKIRSHFLARVTLTALALIILTSCKGTPKTESPEEVIQQFKQATVAIQAADFTVALKMTGADEKENIDFSADLGLRIDRREGVDRKADAKIRMKGSLLSGGKAMSGDLDISVLTAGERLYFYLTKLESNDPVLKDFKTLIDTYSKKWLKVPSDFVPEGLKNIQKKDEEAQAKEKKVKDLFVNTKIFNVNKEYGVEPLNGNKVYHYGIQIDPAGLREYIRKSAEVSGKEMTDAQVEEAAGFAASITDMQMWIGMKDYLLYKGSVAMNGKGADQKIQSDIAMSYEAKSYNSDPKIEEPQNSEELNPLTLMMALQVQSAPKEGVTPPEAAEEAPAPDADKKAEVSEPEKAVK